MLLHFPIVRGVDHLDVGFGLRSSAFGSVNSAIHKAAGLTVHGRSEPKHAIMHACSCEKNGAGGCEITVPLSAFPYPFSLVRKKAAVQNDLLGSFCMAALHCSLFLLDGFRT